MKYQFLVGLILSVLNGLVLAKNENNYSGDCKEIYKYIEGLGDDELSYLPDFLSCEVDNNGNVIYLEIFSYGLKEEDFDKILSYQSIKSLYFDTNDSYHSSSYDRLRHYGNMKSLPKALFRLKNLQSLNLYGYDEFKENEISNLPKSLTSLSFGNVNLKQFSIDELSECTNLKTLELYRTGFSKDIDFTPLKKLNNVTKIKLSNSHSFETVKRYFDPLFITYFDNLNSLNLIEYTFTQENINYITSLTNLKELTFGYCGFDEKVTLDNISNVKTLEKLSILGTTEHCSEEVDLFSDYYCPLTVIPKSIFTLSGLKELSITDQSESDITIELPSLIDINKLTNLEFLDLHGNSLSTIPSSIGDLNKLINLDISDNKLTELPSSFGNLTSLEKLVLGKNNINELPSSFGNLSSLKYLDIQNEYSDNEKSLNSLPDSFGNLKNLEYLYIDNCNLKELPDSMRNLKNLKDLKLTDCKLSTFPPVLSDLTGLENLSIISNNMVDEVPMSLSKLSNLQEIHIGFNDFIQLPSSIGSLPNLKILNAEYSNKLESLPESFGNLENLEELYLLNCGIKSLPDSLSNLKSLKKLQMSENQLTTVPEVLSKITSIEEIDISYNKIDDEVPESLNNLPNLKQFEINGNINIKGKTLTNESLINCNYLSYGNIKNISICKPKNMNCFGYYDKDYIKDCPQEASTPTTTTTTSTTTTTKTTTTTTSKTITEGSEDEGSENEESSITDESLTTVEEITTSTTTIPEDTYMSTKTSTSTASTSTEYESEDETDEFTEVTFTTETETETETETTPTETPPPDGSRRVIPFILGATLGAAAVAAAGAAFFKSSSRTAGNQLAANVFEENVGMENPLYEGNAGQNENPLYEANVDFDSLEDNMNLDAFA